MLPAGRDPDRGPPGRGPAPGQGAAGASVEGAWRRLGPGSLPHLDLAVSDADLVRGLRCSRRAPDDGTVPEAELAEVPRAADPAGLDPALVERAATVAASVRD